MSHYFIHYLARARVSSTTISLSERFTGRSISSRPPFIRGSHNNPVIGSIYFGPGMRSAFASVCARQARQFTFFISKVIFEKVGGILLDSRQRFSEPPERSRKGCIGTNFSSYTPVACAQSHSYARTRKFTRRHVLREFFLLRDVKISPRRRSLTLLNYLTMIRDSFDSQLASRDEEMSFFLTYHLLTVKINYFLSFKNFPKIFQLNCHIDICPSCFIQQSYVQEYCVVEETITMET